MKQTWQKTRKVLHRWVHIIALGYIIPQLRAIKCPDPVLRLIDNTPLAKEYTHYCRKNTNGIDKVFFAG